MTEMESVEGRERVDAKEVVDDPLGVSGGSLTRFDSPCRK